MTTRRVTCDRCGAEIPDARTLLAVRCGPLLALGFARLDLCRACAEALVSWLKTPSAGEGPCADS